jgi:hypothetical protein
LRSYIECVAQKKYNGDRLSPIESNQEIVEITKIFKSLNFKTFVDYKLAGTNIDIVLSNGKKTFGIDLIGFPGQFIDAFSIERYLMFKRANLEIFPISYYEWMNNRSECIRFINKICN